MIRKYIKRPVEILAIKLTRKNYHECIEFLGPCCKRDNVSDSDNERNCIIWVHKKDGDFAMVFENDFIIKRDVGDYDAMTKDRFDSFYKEII